MSVLSNVDIKEIISSDRGILILNRNDDNITGPGYDLRIGFICDADTGKCPSVNEEKENRYELLPEHRYLIVSKEYIYLSGQYMATLYSRASYALKGLLVTSTTVDPNYSGCIYTSLINASRETVFIKQQNAFATMVIHELCTLTTTNVSKNEAGRPMTARETLNGTYCNVNEKAGNAAIRYGANIQQQVQDEYDKAKNRISIRYQQQKDAQTMEEKETALKNQINEIEQKLENLQEKLTKERKKRYLLSGILAFFVTLLTFAICYVFWGWASISFIVSGLVGIIGFLSSIVTLGDHLKKGGKKSAEGKWS